jgi:DNA replication and repair protein RecF
VGSNAQGKTSLLEAIFYLATFESFHATQDKQLVNFLAAREPLAVARIVMDFHPGDLPAGRKKNHHLEIRLIHEANGSNGGARMRKEILVDGVKKKVGEALGQFNAVLFLPQMMQVIEGAPDERRRYLNLAISQVYPIYAASLSEYGQVLSQRNALLKNVQERGSGMAGAAEQLAYWDERLSLYGAQIIHHRIRAIQELERLATNIHQDLSRGQEVLRLDYKPSYDPVPAKPGQVFMKLDAPVDRSHFSPEKIQQGFREDLERNRPDEIARGITTSGPHRDEVRFLGNGIDLGTYGSRGQVRTAMLSMKLAEVAWMKEKTAHWPVLLLDEVLAELDPERRIDLLRRLAACEQVMLTTTDLDLFPDDFASSAHIWQVCAGRVAENSRPA